MNTESDRWQLQLHDEIQCDMGPDSIRIRKGIDSRFPLFYADDPGTVWISNDIYEIARLRGQWVWNETYFAYYLYQEDAATRHGCAYLALT